MESTYFEKILEGARSIIETAVEQVFRLFVDKANELEAWLTSKEAFLTNEDLGNTLDRVEGLERHNNDLISGIKETVTEINEVCKFAAILAAQSHTDIESVNKTSQRIEDRHSRLNRKANERRKMLSDSKNNQLYLTHVVEVLDWMNQKIAIALDESGTEDHEANLKKHENVHLEITANRKRVDAVKTEAEGLIEEDHYQKDTIKKRMDQMEIKWQALMTASTDKTTRLTKTYQDFTHNNTLVQLLSWMDDLENHLKFEDHGNDVMDVTTLLKTHQELEACISSGQSAVEQLINCVQKDTEKSARCDVVRDRYGSMRVLFNVRRDNLEKALLMYQYYEDQRNELAWILDTKSRCDSTDDVILKALESEIEAHEPLTDAVSNAARHMIQSEHFASQEIEKRLDQLHSELQQLKEVLSVRRVKLQDAVKSKQINEKESDRNVSTISGQDCSVTELVLDRDQVVSPLQPNFESPLNSRRSTDATDISTEFIMESSIIVYADVHVEAGRDSENEEDMTSMIQENSPIKIPSKIRNRVDTPYPKKVKIGKELIRKLLKEKRELQSRLLKAEAERDKLKVENVKLKNELKKNKKRADAHRFPQPPPPPPLAGGPPAPPPPPSAGGPPTPAPPSSAGAAFNALDLNMDKRVTRRMSTSSSAETDKNLNMDKRVTRRMSAASSAETDKNLNMGKPVTIRSSAVSTNKQKRKTIGVGLQGIRPMKSTKTAKKNSWK